MKKLISIALISLLFGCGTSSSNSSNSSSSNSTDSGASGYNIFEQEEKSWSSMKLDRSVYGKYLSEPEIFFIDEINYARTKPQEYATKYLKRWYDVIMADPKLRAKAVPRATSMGSDEYAIVSAYETLMNTNPMEPVIPEPGLVASARDHLQDPLRDYPHHSSRPSNPELDEFNRQNEERIKEETKQKAIEQGLSQWSYSLPPKVSFVNSMGTAGLYGDIIGSVGEILIPTMYSDGRNGKTAYDGNGSDCKYLDLLQVGLQKILQDAGFRGVTVDGNGSVSFSASSQAELEKLQKEFIEFEKKNTLMETMGLGFIVDKGNEISTKFGHRVAILTPEYKKIGVAMARSYGNVYGRNYGVVGTFAVDYKSKQEIIDDPLWISPIVKGQKDWIANLSHEPLNCPLPNNI